MAPERTILDAVFAYTDTDGRYVDARRGETVDIPEGDDLDRGDKFGAFTENVGDEPEPVGGLLTPEGDRTLPEIDLDWSDEEANHYIDAATIKEVDADLHAMGTPEATVQAAKMLLGAESSRPVVREGMVDMLQTHIDGSATAPAEETTDGGSGSLDEFVATSTPDQVLAEAGDDPEKALALRLAEEARGTDARKALIKALHKIEK